MAFQRPFCFMFAAGLICFSTACGNKNAPPDTSPAPRKESASIDSLLAKPSDNAPAPAAPAAPVPQEQAQVSSPQPDSQPAGAVDPITFQSSTEVADLTKHLQLFVAYNKRVPRDLNELAQYAHVTLPRVPAGYRMVIDTTYNFIRVEKTK